MSSSKRHDPPNPTTESDAAKRLRKEQRNAFEEDMAAIAALAAAREYHGEVRIEVADSSPSSSAPAAASTAEERGISRIDESSHGRGNDDTLMEIANSSPCDPTSTERIFGGESDDNAPERTWLCPSSERKPRIGSSFQAMTLPTPSTGGDDSGRRDVSKRRVGT